VRASDIAKLLAGKVESVCTMLLPNGKRSGHEWRVGSITGEPGKSMGVHLTGEKSGVWLDGETGQSGDLIGLWMAVKSIDLGEACREALSFLGIQEDRPRPPVERQWKRPTRDGVAKLSDAHATWLRDVRKLPDASLVAYKIASRGERIMFPSMLGDDLVFAKYRTTDKRFSADADCEPILFGWQAIRPEARAVVITEGELDAIAMHAYGAPALSVPTGAGSNGWIDREFDRLERFDTIFLCMDSDAAGQKAIPGIVERLGRERVKVVKLPGKDANDCLIRGVDAATIILALRDARTMDPSELRNVGEFEDDVWAEYSRVDDGLELPWKKTRDMIKLRDGEVSIWAGVNGHGKSAVVSHIAGFLACSGVKTCVASMEFRTSLWLMKMNRQISGVAEPTEMYCRHINQLLAQHMYAFDVAGASKASRILDVFAYARRRYEIKLFVIDNLTKCGFADDDYPGQKKFVEELTDFARTTGTHIMVVAHMKKGETEDKPAGKFNVKGSGGITDMADTLVEIWRNKPRERAVTAAKESGAPIDERFSDQADTRLLVLKQRATGIEPIINLWFNFPTTQFLSSREHNPRPMLDVRGLNFVA